MMEKSLKLGSLNLGSQCAGVHLWSVCREHQQCGNDKAEIWVHLQGHDLLGIRKVWWDDSHNLSVAMEGYKTAKKVRRGSCPVVRGQLECLEF